MTINKKDPDCSTRNAPLLSQHHIIMLKNMNRPIISIKWCAYDLWSGLSWLVCLSFQTISDELWCHPVSQVHGYIRWSSPSRRRWWRNCLRRMSIRKFWSNLTLNMRCIQMLSYSAFLSLKMQWRIFFTTIQFYLVEFSSKRMIHQICAWNGTKRDPCSMVLCLLGSGHIIRSKDATPISS